MYDIKGNTFCVGLLFLDIKTKIDLLHGLFTAGVMKGLNRGTEVPVVIICLH